MSFVLLGILNAQAAGAGGAGAYDLLETTILDSPANQVTFTDITTVAADYKHLQFRIVSREQSATTGMTNFGWRINNQTGGVYNSHDLQGDGSSVTSLTSGTDSFGRVSGTLLRDGETNGAFSAFIVDVLDFNDTNKNTTIRVLGGGVGSTVERVSLTSSLFISTDSMTEIDFLADAVTGARYSLYGIK